LVVLLSYPTRRPAMFDRIRSIYPALRSTISYAWGPLTVALFAIAVLFAGDASATR
jgi:hypothetical protein